MPEHTKPKATNSDIRERERTIFTETNNLSKNKSDYSPKFTPKSDYGYGNYYGYNENSTTNEQKIKKQIKTIVNNAIKKIKEKWAKVYWFYQTSQEQILGNNWEKKLGKFTKDKFIKKTIKNKLRFNNAFQAIKDEINLICDSLTKKIDKEETRQEKQRDELDNLLNYKPEDSEMSSEDIIEAWQLITDNLEHWQKKANINEEYKKKINDRLEEINGLIENWKKTWERLINEDSDQAEKAKIEEIDNSQQEERNEKSISKIPNPNYHLKNNLAKWILRVLVVQNAINSTDSRVQTRGMRQAMELCPSLWQFVNSNSREPIITRSMSIAFKEVPGLLGYLNSFRQGLDASQVIASHSQNIVPSIMETAAQFVDPISNSFSPSPKEWLIPASVAAGEYSLETLTSNLPPKDQSKHSLETLISPHLSDQKAQEDYKKGLTWKKHADKKEKAENKIINEIITAQKLTSQDITQQVSDLEIKTNLEKELGTIINENQTWQDWVKDSDYSLTKSQKIGKICRIIGEIRQDKISNQQTLSLNKTGKQALREVKKSLINNGLSLDKVNDIINTLTKGSRKDLKNLWRDIHPDKSKINGLGEARATEIFKIVREFHEQHIQQKQETSVAQKFVEIVPGALLMYYLNGKTKNKNQQDNNSEAELEENQPITIEFQVKSVKIDPFEGENTITYEIYPTQDQDLEVNHLQFNIINELPSFGEKLSIRNLQKDFVYKLKVDKSSLTYNDLWKTLTIDFDEDEGGHEIELITQETILEVEDEIEGNSADYSESEESVINIRDFESDEEILSGSETENDENIVLREDSGYFSDWDVDTPTNSVFINIDKKSNERKEIYSEDETSDSESEINITLTQLTTEQQRLKNQNQEDFSDNESEAWEDAQEETEEPQEIFYDALEEQNNQENQQIRPEEVIINIQPEENNENPINSQPSYFSQAINKGKKLADTSLNYAWKVAKWAERNPKTATSLFFLGSAYLINQYQQNSTNIDSSQLNDGKLYEEINLALDRYDKLVKELGEINIDSQPDNFTNFPFCPISNNSWKANWNQNNYQLVDLPELEKNYTTSQPELKENTETSNTIETAPNDINEPQLIIVKTNQNTPINASFESPPINPPQEPDYLKKLNKIWRKLTKQWHPDKNNDPQAEEIFKAVANYYEENKLRIEEYPQFKYLNNALVERLASLLNSNSTEILEKLKKIGLTNDQNQQHYREKNPKAKPRKNQQYRGRNTNYEEWKHPTKSQGEEREGLTPNDYHYEGNSEKSQQAAFFQYLKLFATFLMIDKVLFSDELEITEKQLIAISHIEQYWELKANSEGKINEKSCEEILGAGWKEQIKARTTGKEIAKIIEKLKTLIDQAKAAEAATQQESFNHEAEEDNQQEEQAEQERQRQEQAESERREQERQEQEAKRLARERTERERSRQNEYTPNSNFSASSESTNSYSSHTTEEKTTNQTENTSQNSSSFTANNGTAYPTSSETTTTFSAPGGGNYSDGGTVTTENFMAPKSPVEIIQNILNQAQKAIERQQIPPLETAEKKITALFEEKNLAKKQVYYQYQIQLEEKLTQVIQTKTIQEIQLNHLDIARQIEENIEPQKIQNREWKEVIENTPIEKIPELKKEIQNDILWQTRKAVINHLNSLLGSELKVYDLDSSFSGFHQEVYQKPLAELETYQQQVAAHIAEKKALQNANLNNTSFATQQKTSEWKTILPVTCGIVGTAVGIGALYYWLNGKPSQISKAQIISPPQQIKALINQFFTNLKKLQTLGYSAELSQTIQENLQQIQSLTEQWISTKKGQFDEKQWNSFQNRYQEYCEK
ncbi:hypothetical protein [endosymbiont GvMRE of Glomus versiforme]|uniref:hypothetical protein n=1 Tax=endosymbiont GvMRE of Glomus versiforme TaxID=2039283 RepID=UPI000EBE6231|nr:hypothetical protein [endosymbiont GvMRE of Glomus versiforme]RHZ36154.1 hypothetical protein GvMRE_Ic2g137 [endosymbiont GvMRE of Glomus versiforme]